MMKMTEDLYCSIHPLIGEIQAAVYKVPSEISHRFNCFIEALPEPLTETQVIKAITREPYYNESERQLPALQRINSVSRIFTCFFPLFEHVRLEQKISSILREGYFARNPIRSEKIKQLKAAYPELEFGDVMPRVPSRSKSMSIVGPSGSGKSSSVESILGLFPQAIEHVEYNGTPFDRKQLVWLKVSVPPNGSAVALVKEMMFLIDQALGSRFFEKYINKRCGIDTLLLVIKSQIGKLALGLLAIDEIHRLALAKSEDEYKLMEFFNELPELLGIPVLLIGNRKIENLFEKKRLSTNRRYLGNPDHVFSYFAKDKYWDQFIKRLWRYQWTKIKTPIDENLNKAMFWHSVGIADIAVKLYMMIQWKLIGDESEEIITEQIIENVYAEYMGPIHNILDALRKGNSEALNKIDDAWIPNKQLEELKQLTAQKVMMSGVLNSLESQETNSAKNVEDIAESPVLQIAAHLVSAGHPREIAIISAETAVKRFARDTDRKRAFAEAFRLAAQDDESSLTTVDEPQQTKSQLTKESKKKPADIVSLSGDLREIYKKAKAEKKPVYDELKSAGYIKDAVELLGNLHG
jgi:energy-coupling factor transporter ATP-binding protein EcfA2